MSRHPLLALALLRLVTGLIFAAHGFHMIFGQGLPAATAQFQGWGVPLPLLVTPLVATLELAGGGLLALGLGSRPLALLLALVSAFALYFSRGSGAFFGVTDLALPGLLLTSAVALALGGPGQPAFDNMRPAAPSAPPERPAPRKGAKVKGSSG